MSSRAPSLETGNAVPLLARRRRPTVPFFYPDWFILAEIAAHIRTCLRRFGEGKLLDLGCGERPYESYRPVAVTEWVGFDAPSNPTADVHGDAESLPFSDESFGVILCTEVLEHLSQPIVAVREMARVLLPGGHVILTCPQYFPLHEEPHDYFRYTPHGLRHIFEAAGLEVLELRPLATGFRLVATAVNTCLNDFGKSLPGGTTWLGRAAFAPIYALVNLFTFPIALLLPDRKNAVGNALLAKKGGPARSSE